uniref:Uncharacterized protein n=1 Tax=Athene cunicularia TaxID=194338 RepID=A0A663N1K3_ATHCN
SSIPLLFVRTQKSLCCCKQHRRIYFGGKTGISLLFPQNLCQNKSIFPKHFFSDKTVYCNKMQSTLVRDPPSPQIVNCPLGCSNLLFF